MRFDGVVEVCCWSGGSRKSVDVKGRGGRAFWFHGVVDLSCWILGSRASSEARGGGRNLVDSLRGRNVLLDLRIQEARRSEGGRALCLHGGVEVPCWILGSKKSARGKGQRPRGFEELSKCLDES